MEYTFTEERPWGGYEVLLEEKTYKVKRMVVHPHKRCSYQSHAKRNEHWHVVQGMGLVTLDGEEHTLSIGDSIDVAAGQKHRIANTTDEDLVFVEVQTGSYFGEDDIVRFEDDFGREN